MAYFPQTNQVFTAEEIRDTANYISIVDEIGRFNAETIVVHNGLDEIVSLQLQGSVDNSIWIDMGNSFDVSATTNDYETVSDYFPFLRVKASCSVAPTTGNLDVFLVKAASL